MSAGSTSAGTVFGYFANMTSVCGLITWAGICLTYIRFHRGLRAQGIDRTLLPYKSPMQPFAAYFGLIFACIVLFFNGWSVFLKANYPFDTSTFVRPLSPSFPLSSSSLTLAGARAGHLLLPHLVLPLPHDLLPPLEALGPRPVPLRDGPRLGIARRAGFRGPGEARA